MLPGWIRFSQSLLPCYYTTDCFEQIVSGLTDFQFCPYYCSSIGVTLISVVMEYFSSTVLIIMAVSSYLSLM